MVEGTQREHGGQECGAGDDRRRGVYRPLRAPPEYTREVATYLDAALKRVRDSLPMVEAHKAAILAALAITDELFQARRGDREIAGRLTAMADELAHLLPPAKRGSRVAAS